ncbi:hypothetical protein [Halocalculus aciditolerans]|uniref:Uncharacterized protein n=1 Tax=Halocalculus aciditolerans TaxID=1383812 RepID=A0A830FEY7_9EURY|nr:hypothetical protein [Halocalculus aciditolerans]GGL68828.1 hypothetical protein GCM10009039_28500 [Halocalculus aciditolerans]
MTDSAESSTLPARVASLVDAVVAWWRGLDRGYQATVLGVCLLVAVALLG